MIFENFNNSNGHFFPSKELPSNINEAKHELVKNNAQVKRKVQKQKLKPIDKLSKTIRKWISQNIINQLWTTT